MLSSALNNVAALILPGLFLLPTLNAEAGSSLSPDVDLKGQATHIWQEKPSFSAAYSGTNSLLTQRELSHSLTATAYLGVRPWSGTEVYLNGEMVVGVPFSDMTGLAGVPNAELQKASGPTPLFYRPRLFIRQTWGAGGGTEQMESDINQLAGIVDKRRLVLSVGNLAVTDIFDGNKFAHDGRKDFFNWANIAHGAFDYAADVRGYTWGAAMEYYHDAWTFRIGRFLVPRESNGLQLNYSIMNFHGDQAEIEHAHEIAGQPGKLRFLAFRNLALMGRFQDALDYAAVHGGPPDVGNVRKSSVKQGYGLNLEQNLTDDLGMFARASWNDGGTEMFSYTEIEQSLLAGLSLKGSRWGRGQDTVGIAFTENGLSMAHREYLADGGLGFIIGDGRINYRPERVFESYYSLGVAKNSWATVDFQHFTNPAYNDDRGPVNVLGMRLHSEF